MQRVPCLLFPGGEGREEESHVLDCMACPGSSDSCSVCVCSGAVAVVAVCRCAGRWCRQPALPCPPHEPFGQGREEERWKFEETWQETV